jgi:glycosyltransferase involved in cell wall biosynthesis
MAKKLLIFCTQMCETGGIENHIVRFCEALGGSDLEMTLLCPSYGLGRSNRDRMEPHLSKLNVMVSEGGERRPLAERLRWLSLQLIALRKNAYDAIYINGQGGLSYVIVKFLAKAQTKVVVHHHSSADAQEFETWPRLYRRLLQSADEVIACSRTNRDSMRQYLQREVRVIYCFTDPVAPAAPTKPKAHLNFGYFGRLIPEKGIETILKLAEHTSLGSVHWHIWGALGRYKKADFEGKERLSYHGAFETQDGLVEALSSLDAFVLFTRHNEGLPLVLLEAMSAGVPWIASERGGIPDIVIDPQHTALLAREFTDEDALRTTQTMAEDIRNQRVHRDRLVDAYRGRFHPEVLVTKWQELFSARV